MAGNLGYFTGLAIAFDQLVNALFGGSPKETISAAAWRRGEFRGWQRWYYARIVIDSIFFWQKTKDGRRHCQQAFDNEIARAYLAKEYKSST